MEGYGFFSAARANQQVDALIVRGISDLIDNKSKADAANSQEIAARHASAFAFEMLANLCTEEQAFVSQERIQSIEETGHKVAIQDVGPVQAPIQVGNHNTINNFIPSTNEVGESTTFLVASGPLSV
jgi:hypothetical protein